MIYKKSPDSGTLRQGEIISELIHSSLDITQTEFDDLGKRKVATSHTSHSFAIVVTQDCDLEQDYTERFTPFLSTPPDKLRFKPSEFSKPLDTTIRLANHSEPLLQYIWNLLDERLKGKVQIAESKRDNTTLFDVLNHLIDRNDLFISPEGFPDGSLLQTTVNALIDGSLLQRKNRLFLADVFAGDLVPHPNLLPNLLFCEMMDIPQAKNRIDGNTWKRVETNSDVRYHGFEGVKSEEDALAIGFGPLCVDFKRCFTIPSNETYLQLTYQAKRRCYMESPYLEHFSSRIGQYISRVGLPVQHNIKT